MVTLEILSYLGAIALVVVVAWSFVVMLRGPGILTRLNNRCDKYSAACGAEVGFLIPLLLVALASAIFLFYRLRHVTSPVVSKAKTSPQDLVETAAPDIGEIVGRDELCRVIMEDIHRPGVIHRFDSLRVIYISGRRACMKDGLFLEMIGLPHTNQKKQAIAMYHTTGFSSDELIDICVLITSVDREPGAANWPPCLGLLDSVVATLAYLRHNRTQVEIGESLGVSQPTISRAITVITPLLSAALAEHVATADDLDPEAQYIVDGTLLPCWSWAGCKELYSGKHKTTGMNVQVACTIYGKLAWISDPVNGSRHDNYCLGESDVLRTLDPKNWIGDKGYIGNEMITPFRKPEGRELLDWQKEFNTEVNKIRWMIEQVISHFKNWTVMHTDYRRPLSTFATTISAVIGLHFYRMA